MRRPERGVPALGLIRPIKSTRRQTEPRSRRARGGPPGVSHLFRLWSPANSDLLRPLPLDTLLPLSPRVVPAVRPFELGRNRGMTAVLEKLEQARQALGGQVFDVLGKLEFEDGRCAS